MEKKIKSEGKCLFCGKMFSKAGINRHLSTHLEKIAQSGKAGTSFLVKVETDKRWGATPYFLSLWVDGGATLKNIDQFLRDIWLECCGHLSAFRNPQRKSFVGENFLEAMKLIEKGKIKKYEKLMEEDDDEIPMSRKAKEVLDKGLALEYEYDFGSSTELTLTVIDKYAVKTDPKIVLLSRNEPLPIMCAMCGKVPATQICTVCMDEEDAEFCDQCAQKHAETCSDFKDYASLPVVNSPRMGICAYDGGIIDTERDGVFVLKE
ncbi:MAG: hypothetical protein FWF52_00630 [Candidatus Azobacteroides sp.]|nr:hypothetical protein [Candidatus Azobacteroides sp.]